MTPKRQRLYLVLGALCSLALSFFFISRTFNDNLVFFFSPTDLAEKSISSSKNIRAGGVVETGSLEKHADGRILFRITDYKNTVDVEYNGILPDLFKEGQGVVAEGNYADGRLMARQVLAKHDERYMPPEVAKALKKSGRWQEIEGKE